MSGIQYLDSEIANEGLRATMDGAYGIDEQGNFMPFTEKPRIPTFDFVAKNGQDGKPHPLRKYFPEFSGRPYTHQLFPAIFYHRTKEPITVRNAAQLKAIEVEWDTDDRRWVYDKKEGEWSPKPFPGTAAAKPDVAARGKSLVEKGKDALGNVAAIVVAILEQLGVKATGIVAPAPAAVPSPAALAEFEAFQAWKTAQAAKADVPAPGATSNVMAELESLTKGGAAQNGMPGKKK